MQNDLTIPVRSLVGKPGTMEQMDFEVELEERWGTEMVEIPSGDSIGIELRMESVHEGVLATGTAFGKAKTECSRCLTELDEPFRVAFQELFAYSGQSDDDLLVIDNTVDIEEVVRDAVVISFPFQPVCDEDCMGLCAECGINLNEQPDHVHEGQIDPRWAELKKLKEEE
jgi:uncharacterized protein